MKNVLMYPAHAQSRILIAGILKGLGKEFRNFLHQTFFSVAQNPDMIISLFNKCGMNLGINCQTCINFFNILSGFRTSLERQTAIERILPHGIHILYFIGLWFIGAKQCMENILLNQRVLFEYRYFQSLFLGVQLLQRFFNDLILIDAAALMILLHQHIHYVFQRLIAVLGHS